MKHKFLTTALASVMLLSGSAITLSSTTVNAADHSFHSSYWHKNRRVMTMKTVTFKKFDAKRFRYTKARKRISLGTNIYVRNAGEFDGWVLAGTKPGSRYWWVYPSKSTKWMLENPKTHKEGWNGNTYTSSNGSKLKVNSITRYSVVGFDSKKEEARALVLDATFTNNGHKWISPNKFIEDNISIYPTDDKSNTLDFVDDSIALPEEDDDIQDAISNTTEDVVKGDSADFYMVLDEGFKYDGKFTSDKNLSTNSSYTLEDLDGHKITVPVTTEQIVNDSY